MSAKEPGSTVKRGAVSRFRAAYRDRLIAAGMGADEAEQIAGRTEMPKSAPVEDLAIDQMPLSGKLRDGRSSPSPARAGNGKSVDIDYRSGKVPGWVQEAIETSLAIDAEDAKEAGQIGFMARALVVATMPYKDPKTDAFTRANGDFKLRIVAGYEGGVPYGIYPRLLMSWVATEAVRTQSPVIELGDSLSIFLRDVLDIKRGGGKRGSSTRVADQMKRLFGSLITAQYTGGLAERGFTLRNVMIAEGLDLYEDDLKLEPDQLEPPAGGSSLWVPQVKEEAGTWRSKVRLSEGFFNECVDRPVPIDLRAYKALRGSPLAMDIYTWLTFRMSYMHGRSRPIRWEALMGQFGSGYTTPRAVLDFKKNFLTALKAVLIVYPKAQVEVANNGLILLPSPPHISKQGGLFP